MNDSFIHFDRGEVASAIAMMESFFESQIYFIYEMEKSDKLLIHAFLCSIRICYKFFTFNVEEMVAG